MYIESFFRLPSILEYLRKPLQAGLGDRSAYVRKTAVMGIIKVFYIAPHFITGELWCAERKNRVCGVVCRK